MGSITFSDPDASLSPDDAEDAKKPGLLARVLTRLRTRRVRDDVETEPETDAAPQLEERAQQDELVYYLTGDGRNGPVPMSVLYQKVAEGELDLVTPVSRNGTSDWLGFADFLKAQADRAADSRADAAKKGPGAIPWLVVSSPLWGGMVPILATQVWITLGHKPLAYQEHLWWSVWVLSCLACYIDARSRKKGGDKVGAVDLWLSLLLPFYLYRRQKSASTLICAFTLWCASSLVALAGFVLVNGYNAPIITVIERMDHVQRHLH